ncbi:hypothetical protein T05_14064 [Trichinella murrelli]|uniref:Uncharacterized protein n=1 Tax=Trichinella murrelli TaxID=144512 RepID=A0A0V0TZX6_9BILA|nr:hypothetical protein T05_14064 [Trichinella murrelli]
MNNGQLALGQQLCQNNYIKNGSLNAKFHPRVFNTASRWPASDDTVFIDQQIFNINFAHFVRSVNNI